MRKTVVVLLTSLLLASLPTHGSHVAQPGEADDDLDEVVHDCRGDHDPTASGNDLASLWAGAGPRDFDYDEDEVVDETLKLVVMAVVLGESVGSSADARLLVQFEANNRVLGTVLEAPDGDWSVPEDITVVTADARTTTVPLKVEVRDVGFSSTPTSAPDPAPGSVPNDPRTYYAVELGYRFADVFAPGPATATAPFVIDEDEWHVETFYASGDAFTSADVMSKADSDCPADAENASATVVPDDPVVTGVTATPAEDVDRRPETKVKFRAEMDLGGGDGDRGGYTYEWTFTNGDATPITSTAAEPEVRFSELEPVHVKVKVTDDLGKESNLYDSTQDPDVPDEGLVLFENLPPVSDFRIQGNAVPVAGAAVAFEDISFDPEEDDVTAWSWDFDDTSPLVTQRNPSHTFPDVGTYDVTLTVTDEHGATDDHTLRVFVCQEAGDAGCKPANAGPQASFEASARQVTQGGKVTFTDASTDRDGTITAWDWDFGDGATSDDQNPEHTFTKVGTFSVTLTVTDDGGLQGTRALPVRVVVAEDDGEDDPADLLPAPLAAFTLDPDPVVGEPVRFRDNSTAQTKLVAWTWFFGDGSPAGNGADVSHTYEETGTYRVRLTVTDERGVRDTTSRSIVVGSGETDEGAPGLPVAFLLAGLALAAVAVRRRD